MSDPDHEGPNYFDAGFDAAIASLTSPETIEKAAKALHQMMEDFGAALDDGPTVSWDDLDEYERELRREDAAVVLRSVEEGTQ